MIPPPTAIYRRVTLLIALAVCGPALVYFAGGRLLPDLLIVGLGYGTVVGHPVLAAAWCALGPGPLRWRLPISFAWTCLVSISVVLPAVMDRYLPRGELLLVVPVAIGIWLLVQVPLWGISLLFGLQLRYQAGSSAVHRADNRERQFGIRQLMIYTAAVGVLLGIGRLILPPLIGAGPPDRFMWILGLVFGTQILTSLPLIFAALLPRLAIPSVLLALFLLAAGTAFEIWIAQQMSGWNPRSDHWAVIAINITGALWTLAAAAIVRKSGYHFGVPTPESLAANQRVVGNARSTDSRFRATRDHQLPSPATVMTTLPTERAAKLPNEPRMIPPPPTFIYRCAAVLIGAGIVLVFFTISLFSLNRNLNQVLQGLLYGTLLQHALLAGMWCVLGPASFAWRAPLSFVWIALLGLVMLLPRSNTGIEPTAYVEVLVVAGLWLGVQLPLGVLTLFFRLRLGHRETSVDAALAAESQFGVRQIMAFTALVAVMLAVARLLAYQQLRPGVYFQTDWLFPTLLAILQVVMCLPLTLACLLPRHALPFVLVSLLCMALITTIEEPLLKQLTRLSTGEREYSWLFGTLNACSLGWTIAFASVVRRSGYYLGVSRPFPIRRAS